MFEATVSEFPFVAELPKREKSKLQNLWDHFKEVQAITEKKGTIVPPVLAAELLGVSKQRVYDLIKEGRFDVVTLRGQMFITETDLLAYAQSERKAGRPAGPTTYRECVKIAVGAGVRVHRDLRHRQKEAKK